MLTCPNFNLIPFYVLYVPLLVVPTFFSAMHAAVSVHLAHHSCQQDQTASRNMGKHAGKITAISDRTTEGNRILHACTCTYRNAATVQARFNEK